jgi:hypothetical protein
LHDLLDDRRSEEQSKWWPCNTGVIRGALWRSLYAVVSDILSYQKHFKC